MGDIRQTSTPYDDVFRTLLNDCSQLIIPVINEIFGETYTGEETIVFAPNEHFMNRQDGQEDEQVTDASFRILGKEPKKYHLECQSTPDRMKIRMVTPGGTVSILENLGVPTQTILDKIQDQYHLSPEASRQYL